MSENRLPAEWEPHAATWIAWPHNADDWQGQLESVKVSYHCLIDELSKSEKVEVLCEEESIKAELEAQYSNLEAHHIRTNRSWLRDSGPIGVFREGQLCWINWGFNAWALYDDFQLDNNLPSAISKITGLELVDKSHVILEGGMLDSNGQGSLLVTEECLLSNKQVRNPTFGRRDYEALFEECFGINNCIWLGQGVIGDDTHGHVDDIARFVSSDTVLCAIEENKEDANYEALRDNYSRLDQARNSKGEKLKVEALPMPQAVCFRGERYPASYANFYIANSVVLMPTFQDEQDEVAYRVLEQAFPERRVVGIDCRNWVIGQGTLHCSTQQQPR